MSGLGDVLGGLTAGPPPPPASPFRRAKRRYTRLRGTARWRWWRRCWHAALTWRPRTRCAPCLAGSHPPCSLTECQRHMKRCAVGNLETPEAPITFLTISEQLKRTSSSLVGVQYRETPNHVLETHVCKSSFVCILFALQMSSYDCIRARGILSCRSIWRIPKLCS